LIDVVVELSPTPSPEFLVPSKMEASIFMAAFAWQGIQV
jgi:hypothetical protein